MFTHGCWSSTPFFRAAKTLRLCWSLFFNGPCTPLALRNSAKMPPFLSRVDSWWTWAWARTLPEQDVYMNWEREVQVCNVMSTLTIVLKSVTSTDGLVSLNSFKGSSWKPSNASLSLKITVYCRMDCVISDWPIDWRNYVKQHWAWLLNRIVRNLTQVFIPTLSHM